MCLFLLLTRSCPEVGFCFSLCPIEAKWWLHSQSWGDVRFHLLEYDLNSLCKNIREKLSEEIIVFYFFCLFQGSRSPTCWRSTTRTTASRSPSTSTWNGLSRGSISPPTSSLRKISQMMNTSCQVRRQTDTNDKQQKNARARAILGPGEHTDWDDRHDDLLLIIKFPAASLSFYWWSSWHLSFWLPSTGLRKASIITGDVVLVQITRMESIPRSSVGIDWYVCSSYLKIYSKVHFLELNELQDAMYGLKILT